MTERPNDWGTLQEQWQRTGSASVALDAVLRQMKTRRRALLVARLVEGGIASSAVVLVALALRHAANPFEAALGLLVGGGIALAWTRRMAIRRLEHATGTTSSAEHLVILRHVRVTQLRLAQFVPVVLCLALVFFVPWWVIGARVHKRSLADADSWLVIWLPLAVMAALLVWSFRVWRQSRDAIRALDRLREQFDGN